MPGTDHGYGLAVYAIASWLWLAAVAATCLGVGYAWGRRHGRRQGHRLALAEAPLRLRAEALVRGTCPVCDHVAVEAPPPDPECGDMPV